jgi:quinohemoprotein ethanol dehydrogenase
MNASLLKILLPIIVLLLTSCDKRGSGEEDSASAPPSVEPASSSRTVGVDASRIINADSTPGDWLTHGRTYSEQRFSPLTQISDKNIADLGLAWYADLPTKRGVEATPLMADGKLYVTSSWSHVLALDARTGELLWHFDPKVPKDYSVHTCCDVVNRGVALWGDKVYVGSLDGRMIALDRDTGTVVWEVDTRINDIDSYSITGAPRVVNGKVIIGNGGAEMGVRGYVTAYDAETGALSWRFFTVPGNPADGFEDETQERIADSWTGEWWKHGKGGGTAWDSFAYDPELKLLYIGVGNGASWNQKIRSPEGGDNLFLSSIVAVNADTGKYVWHYQTTPGDNWDYTATQSLILAELDINGSQRKVIMQAPKNGFFYVIDRVTGELISAEKYMPVTWATHVDMKTGRPVEAEGVRSGSAELVISPGPSGAHNWNPMSYSPATGYVYIPAMLTSAIYEDDFYAERRKTVWNTNYSASTMVTLPDEMTVKQRAEIGPQALKGVLVARDPVSNREIWRQALGFYSGGGVLSTQGNLLFQGDMQGGFTAYAADTGKQLWSRSVQSGVMAGPISYQLDGEQYIAVLQGWGGETGVPFGAIAGPLNMVNISRVLVYKLGGEAQLPVIELQEQTLSAPGLTTASSETVEQGRELYNTFCIVCHGGNAVSSGLVPDLRYRISELDPAWQTIVIDGVLKVNGMPAWDQFISRAEADAIKSYVIHEAELGHQRGERRMVKKVPTS